MPFYSLPPESRAIGKILGTEWKGGACYLKIELIPNLEEIIKGLSPEQIKEIFTAGRVIVLEIIQALAPASEGGEKAIGKQRRKKQGGQQKIVDFIGFA